MNFAWSSDRLASGVYSSPVFWSTITACRWPKVPRRESWPASRTGWPSMSSDPMARVSPMAQSIESSSIIVARFCSCGSRRGWTVKPSGRLIWDSTTRLITSSVTVVGTSAHSGPTCGVCGSTGCLAASRTSAKTRSSCSW